MTATPSALASLRARGYVLAALGLIALGGFFAAQMALQTKFDVHPDEIAHTRTFCFFETHVWLPPLNSPDVAYDLHGQSRVYSREVVYQVFGPLAGVLHRVTGQTGPCEVRYLTYRLFNVLTFLVTLGIVFAVGARHPWAAALGVLLLATPQVIYVYSYANSDAFALTASLCLLLLALTERQPLASRPRTLLLALLTSLVVLSKSSYWVTVVFAYGVLAWQFWHSQRSRPAGNGSWRAPAAKGLVLLVVVLALVTPLRVYYPLSQGGNFAAQVEQMREEHAIPELRPSTATYPTYRLRDQGVGFGYVLTNVPWMVAMGMSFYGLFGYMTEHAPRLAYALAAAVLALNGLLTVRTAARHWPAVPGSLKVALLLGFGTGVLAVFAAMLYAWIGDFQAQGRYLFPILVTLALASGGTWALETKRVRALRLATAAVGLALSVYTLWQSVLNSPLVN